MEIKLQLLEELSHFNMHFVADFVGNDKVRFDEIMRILMEENDPLPARAAWVAEIVTQKNPDFILPYMDKLVHKLSVFTHPGSRRNSLKILSRHEIPEELQGVLIDICFKWIEDAEKTVAVKIFALQIIENHLPLYPELAYELQGVIENQWGKNSVGFKSRAGKILKTIQKYT